MKTDVFQDLAIPVSAQGQNLWRWLHGQIRAAIINGRLRTGNRLPSSRSLAAQYNVSRGTVVKAYKQLIDEGLISGESSSGTFVSELFEGSVQQVHRPGRLEATNSSKQIAARARAALQGVAVLPPTRRIGLAFRAYEPALDYFPVELWARVAARVMRHAPRSLYGQGSASGYGPLKKAIADYVGPARGVRCSPDQIIVTSGAQQSLDLLSRVLLDPGDKVWMEDPGYSGALDAFRSAAATVIPLPIDEEGMDVRAGRKLAPQARLAYVTPSSQFPLGMPMSARRRMDLLEWAREADAWVIEDDYDSEYRYSVQPVPSLQSLDDKSTTVIYVGTFTKMLFNALRIGFMVLPEGLVASFEAVRSFVDRHPPTLDQAILSEFILEGHFGHHVQKMRKLYLHRKNVLVEVVAKQIGNRLTLANVDSGMKAVAWLPQECSDVLVASKAQAQGLEVLPISMFSLKNQAPPGLILGFAGCNDQELGRGAELLNRVLLSL